MPRSLRDAEPGIHHVGQNATGALEYFRDDLDHLTWLRRFVHVLERHDWTCLAFCHLSTHWHALLEIPDESLPEGMHALNSEYGKAYNARHGRVGYLVRDRYWNRRKATSREILSAFRYVVRNELETGLVVRAEESRWCSFATTVGLTDSFPFVDATLVLSQFGPSPGGAKAALRDFVNAP